MLDDVARRYDFAATVPVCARTGENMDRLQDVVEARVPIGPPVFPQDHFTDRSEAFLAAEIVREKLIRRLGPGASSPPHRGNRALRRTGAACPDQRAGPRGAETAQGDRHRQSWGGGSRMQGARRAGTSPACSDARSTWRYGSRSGRDGRTTSARFGDWGSRSSATEAVSGEAAPRTDEACSKSLHFSRASGAVHRQQPRPLRPRNHVGDPAPP